MKLCIGGVQVLISDLQKLICVFVLLLVVRTNICWLLNPVLVQLL